MDVLQIIINICSTFGVSGLLLFFVKRHYDKKDETLKDNRQEQQKQNSQADRDMLRDAMLRTYHNCYEVKGWISVNDLESFQHMFESYTALHGNGMIPSVREKIMDLPTVPPEKKE